MIGESLRSVQITLDYKNKLKMRICYEKVKRVCSF